MAISIQTMLMHIEHGFQKFKSLHHAIGITYKIVACWFFERLGPKLSKILMMWTTRQKISIVVSSFLIISRNVVSSQIWAIIWIKVGILAVLIGVRVLVVTIMRVSSIEV